MRKYVWLLVLLVFSTAGYAGQYKTIKDAEVHYVVFNSTFLTPEVARSYGLKRNDTIAIVNISVLDRASLGKPAMSAEITGEAKNLIGQTKKLDFKEIKEGDAIYYLAQFSITNEERYQFTIDVDAGMKGRGPISFSQQLYTEK